MYTVTALYGICSQLVYQPVCSKLSARQSQHLASLVSMLPVLGVLVYLLKHTHPLRSHLNFKMQLLCENVFCVQISVSSWF